MGFEEHKRNIGLSACLAPVIGGAILYYSLRSTQPQAANYANRVSWIAFVVWAVVGTGVSGAIGASETGQMLWQSVGGLAFLAGLVLSVITLNKVSKLPPAPPSV